MKIKELEKRILKIESLLKLNHKEETSLSISPTDSIAYREIRYDKDKQLWFAYDVTDNIPKFVSKNTLYWIEIK